jgi:choline dehydrogenase
VSDHRWQPTLARRCTRPRCRPASPPIHDFNGATQDGVGYYQSTITARGAVERRAYLSGAKQRKNLTIATSAHATRVLIENGRATASNTAPDGLATARRRAR